MLKKFALKEKAYSELESKIKSSKRSRERYISGITKPIMDELSKYNLDASIYGRVKSYSSIYGKIIERNKIFNEIYDLYAIRIIVEKIENCYLALGVVHSLYTPMQDRFKDFIANPKSNGYQSVHTTVFGPNANMIEIQIRTKEMEETAEIGIAAHWVYKNGKSSKIDKNVKWLRELLDILKSESTDPKEFMDILKIDLYNEQIFVFTPKGDLKTLRKGATALDFAFEIHTQIGMTCLGVKVNGKLVALSHILSSGDQVEIITSKKQYPRKDWLRFVVTSHARTRIKSALKREEKIIAEKGKDCLLYTSPSPRD